MQVLHLHSPEQAELKHRAWLLEQMLLQVATVAVG